MTEHVKLSRVRRVLDDLSYPIPASAATAALEDVVVTFADGEERLSDVVARSNAAEYGSAAELEEELYANLPIEAVGEPGQSEGEG